MDSWNDRRILAGQQWDQTIKQALEAAEIIVLLVSESFLRSDYVQHQEIPLAKLEHGSSAQRFRSIDET